MSLARMLGGWFAERVGRGDPQGTQALSRQSQLEQARALMLQGLHAAAEVQFEELAERFPDDAVVRNELGVAKYSLGDFAGAETAFREALALAPCYATALCNLGQTLQVRGSFSEALPLFEAALQIEPGHGMARSNLAVACYALGDRQRAAAACADLITATPEDASAHVALGECLLALEEFEAGWREYEWRLRVSEYAGYFRSYSQPLWDGLERPGASLLIWPEQGYGDTLQFMRLARHVAERMRSMQVILETPPGLFRLARYSFADCANLTVVESQRPPPVFTCHLSVMSLAHVLRQSLSSNPIPVPYLRAEPGMIAQWAGRLEHACEGGVRVGLVWAGNRRHQLGFTEQAVDARRSIGAELLSTLLDVPGCDFVNLQVGAHAADMASLGLQLIDFTADLADFADSAALIASLDLVLTVDTAVVHLVGAIGKPVWMLSRSDACWRWGARRKDIPWYPTLRPFYLPVSGAWEQVLQDVRRALLTLVNERAGRV